MHIIITILILENWPQDHGNSVAQINSKRVNQEVKEMELVKMTHLKI